MNVGFAARKITPPLGTSLAGYGLMPNRRAASVHDDLWVRAAVFDDAAIVVLDIISISSEIVSLARQAIEKRAGLKQALIAATHSHTAPTASFMRQWGDLEPAYIRTLPGIIADAVAEACQKKRPSEVSIGGHRCPGIAVNRVHPDAPVDDEARALFVRTDGKLAGVLANFACHPVCPPMDSTYVSADFPGVFCREIERQTGAFPMFLQGCCGDINPEGFVKGMDYAQKHGLDLAQAVLTAERRPIDGRLRIASATVELPLDVEGARREAEEYLALGKTRKDHEWLTPSTFLRDWAVETLSRPAHATMTAEIQAVSIGDWTLVALPGEIYTFVSTEIRKRRPGAWTLGYANGNVGYIPEPRDYAEGTYAAYMTPKLYGFLTFRPTVGEALIDGAVRVLEKLK